MRIASFRLEPDVETAIASASSLYSRKVGYHTNAQMNIFIHRWTECSQPTPVSVLNPHNSFTVKVHIEAGNLRMHLLVGEQTGMHNYINLRSVYGPETDWQVYAVCSFFRFRATGRCWSNNSAHVHTYVDRFLALRWQSQTLSLCSLFHSKLTRLYLHSTNQPTVDPSRIEARWVFVLVPREGLRHRCLLSGVVLLFTNLCKQTDRTWSTKTCVCCRSVPCFDVMFEWRSGSEYLTRNEGIFFQFILHSRNKLVLSCDLGTCSWLMGSWTD